MVDTHLEVHVRPLDSDTGPGQAVLTVGDIEAAHRDLAGRGVETSDI
ncbi:hypothetical protein [Mycobacterium parmense]|uniref:Uncharacterized protein n=1 Tax=Mycobacterium parmense TaxID=185642 RepID=A0A7I7YWM4_9MYCO|nr:hypothetical protein [Mycobacterium parmense]MCV7350881.1 hypothetical protein [Mycobacterium parmense]BBZ45687.1 hypothetical protein MPRM_29680 [Mycobacterium parmense]